MWLRNYFLTLFVENKAIARVGSGRTEEQWQMCPGQPAISKPQNTDFSFQRDKYRPEEYLTLVYSGQTRDTAFASISNTGWEILF